MVTETQQARAYLAELVGTFLFVLMGAGSICLNNLELSHPLGLPGIALAHGVTLSIVISAIGHVSGGHVNPAVTVAFYLTQRLPFRSALIYVLMQLLGAVLAGVVLSGIFPFALSRVANLGTPILGIGVDPQRGIVIETVATFFLVFAVFGTAVDPRAAKIGGFGIGLSLFCSILVFGPLTGAALNPARWFGPALVAGFPNPQPWEWLAFTLGPVSGAILAAWLYDRLLLAKEAPSL